MSEEKPCANSHIKDLKEHMGADLKDGVSGYHDFSGKHEGVPNLNATGDTPDRGHELTVIS